MKLTPVVPFILLALSACGGESKSELDIVRGRAVAPDSPAFLNTVELTMGFSGCTGSIIGEKLIMTAAHCVEDVKASDIHVHFQRSNSKPAVDKTIEGVRVKTFKAEGSAFFPQFDMAWVELKEKIPAPFKPMEILRDPSQLNSSTKVLLAGYGMIADDCVGAQCSGKLLEGNTELQNYYDKPHIMSLLVFYGDSRKSLSGACYGDSGGPAYVQVNNRWFLGGVTNGFVSTLAPESNGGCDSGWDIYTFAGDYVPWLQQSSGFTLPLADASQNRDRAQPPLVMSGPSQTSRPTNWTEWVGYANHEDPAWYTMDAILDSLAGGYRELGLAKNQMTEVLYNAALSAPALTSQTSLYIYQPALKDLTPIGLFSKLERLELNTAELENIRALDALSQLRFLSLYNVKKAPTDIFNQIPQMKSHLFSLNLQSPDGLWLSGLDWTPLNGLPALEIHGAAFDLTPLSTLSVRQLTLEKVNLKGRFDPAVAPDTLILTRVTDKEQRGNLDWLGNRSGLKTLKLNRLPQDSIGRLGDFGSLQTLHLENMGLTQAQVESLALPVSLQNLAISGNQVTNLPQTASWKGLQSLTAFDNPLLDKTCPTSLCRLDKHVKPISLREYCENVALWPAYSYAYEDVLWAITVRGPSENGAWTMNCETIEKTAAAVRDLDFHAQDIDDIRPLIFLSDSLETLDLSLTLVRDVSLLAPMKRLGNLYIDGTEINVDLDLFVQNPGLRIIGINRDPKTAVCPIPGGYCYFSQGSSYAGKYGPLLGTSQSLNIDSVSEVTLPGQNKTFRTYL